MSAEINSKVLASARELWQICFPEDSQLFVDFYFSKVATERETLIEYDAEGQAIAHIGVPRYSLGLSSHQAIPSLYISGACVLPEYRMQGVMREMMTRLIQEATDVDAITLIPASEELRGYYERTFGFVTCGGQSYQSNIHLLGLEDEELQGQTEPHLLLAATLSTRLGIRLSAVQCEALLRAYQLEEGIAVSSYRDKSSGLYTGVMLFRYEGVKAYVDCIVGGRESRTEMLEEVEQLFDIEEFSFRTFSPDGEARGMVRPRSLLPILKLWGENHPSESLAFSYEDRLFPELSGTYQVERGAVSFNPQVQTAPLLSLREFCHYFLPALDISLVFE